MADSRGEVHCVAGAVEARTTTFAVTDTRVRSLKWLDADHPLTQAWNSVRAHAIKMHLPKRDLHAGSQIRLPFDRRDMELKGRAVRQQAVCDNLNSTALRRPQGM